MRKLVCLFFVILMTGFCEAQDPHFSQYYASPTTVNPAATGFFQGDSRITALYRQQWPEFGEPFVTGTTSLEFKPEKFKNGSTQDRLAYGLMLLYDKTPDAVLKSQHAYFLFGYHKALDEEGYHRLGIGFMGGFNQKTLDATQLTFSDEFQSGGFQQGSGETVPSKKLSAFDLHAGVLYSYEDDFKTYYLGGSVYHLTSPKNYFLENNQVLKTIPKRWNLNAGININSNSIQYAGSLLFMRQAKVNEILVGGTIGIPFNMENGVFYIGSWYRFKESVIPTINLQWKKANLGFSYDVSSNRTMTRPRTMEVSIAVRPTKFRDTKTGCYSF
jgi:type IX secretion system PorP/SprF family membrane protein